MCVFKKHSFIFRVFEPHEYEIKLYAFLYFTSVNSVLLISAEICLYWCVLNNLDVFSEVLTNITSPILIQIYCCKWARYFLIYILRLAMMGHTVLIFSTSINYAKLFHQHGYFDLHSHQHCMLVFAPPHYFFKKI